MKILFIIWIALFTLIQAGVTDDAYSAYKSGDRRKAFQLYAKGEKEGNIKATYNLALFYEKGIGTKKNLPEALRLYKKVTQSIRNSDDYCTSSQRRYYKKTFRKLGQYEKDTTYLHKLKKLEKDCKYIENPWSDEDSAFMKKCPSARFIPEKDRKAIYLLPCTYFKHHPKLMKRYMPLYQQVHSSINYGEISEETYKRALKKIRTLVKPLLRDLKKQEITCYKKTRTVGDDEACYIDYIYNLDILFGSNMIEMYNEGMYYCPDEKDRKRVETEDKVRKAKVLTEQEKKKSIQKARKELRNDNFLPEDLKLIFKLP